MSETTYCFVSTMACKGELCDHYHEATGLCKITMLVNRLLGDVDGEKQPVQDPVVKAPLASQRFPDLEEGNYETLTGEIVSPAETREVNTRGGPKMVSNVLLTDGETTVRIGLWGDLVDEIEKLGAGEVVTINNLSVKAPYDNMVQLSSTKNTKISR